MSIIILSFCSEIILYRCKIVLNHYYIRNIYEEDNQKFAIIYDDEHKLYRLDFSLTEEGMTLADEIVEVKEEFVETENMVKFAEPENVEQYREFAKVEENNEDDDIETEMPAEDMKAKIAELETQVSERDNIIMANEKELAELRKFQSDVYDSQKALKVEETMQKYAQFMEKDVAENLKAEGMECNFSEVDAWTNKVKASIADKVIAKTAHKEEDGITRMSAPLDENKKSGSVWGRI